MHLDGFGIRIDDMPVMVRFYRDVLGFAIKEEEETNNAYPEKDSTLFLRYGKRDFEKMTQRTCYVADPEENSIGIGSFQVQ